MLASTINKRISNLKSLARMPYAFGFCRKGARSIAPRYLTGTLSACPAVADADCPVSPAATMARDRVVFFIRLTPFPLLTSRAAGVIAPPRRNKDVRSFSKSASHTATGVFHISLASGSGEHGRPVNLALNNGGGRANCPGLWRIGRGCVFHALSVQWAKKFPRDVEILHSPPSSCCRWNDPLRHCRVSPYLDVLDPRSYRGSLWRRSMSTQQS